jgi:plasmid stability protein
MKQSPKPSEENMRIAGKMHASPMAVLTIKDLDSWIYESIKARAKRNRRSIVAEAAMILETALKDEEKEAALMERARQLREQYPVKIESHEELLRMIDEGRP